MLKCRLLRCCSHSDVLALVHRSKPVRSVSLVASAKTSFDDVQGSYETVSEKHSNTLEVKRSKFIATVWPVKSAEQALKTFAEASDPAASHNCWAYKVGDQYRSSDDGEPGGTAGPPIQSAISGEEVDGVAVLVTRHFGGTKLGAGGLIRSYGAAARETLRGAPRCSVKPHWELHIQFSVDDIGAVYNAVDKAAARRLSETFNADGRKVTLLVRLPAEDAATLVDGIADTTSGRAVVTQSST